MSETVDESHLGLHCRQEESKSSSLNNSISLSSPLMAAPPFLLSPSQSNHPSPVAPLSL